MLRNSRSARRYFRLAYICLLAGMPIVAPCAGQTSPYSVVVVEEMLGRVTILNSDDPARRVSVAVGFKPHEVVVSPDGKTAFVSDFGLNDADNRDGIAGEAVMAVDIPSATVRLELRLPNQLKAPHGLGIRPRHGAELFTNAEQGDEMVVFDGDNGHVKRTFPLPAGVHNFIFSKTGAQIFAFAPGGVIYCLDADSGKIQATRDLGSPVRGLAWTGDERYLLASVRGGVAMLDKESFSTVRDLALPSTTQPFYSAATPDSRLILVPAVFDGEVTVFDARSGAMIRRLRTGTPLRVVMSPDPDLAYVANVSPRGEEVSVIHLTSLEITHILGLRDVNGLAFSPILPTALRN